jgi:hypothetical protein
MIYSAAFDALPGEVRARIYERIYHSDKFARLSSADRRAILEIVADTKPDVPVFWKESAAR